MNKIRGLIKIFLILLGIAMTGLQTTSEASNPTLSGSFIALDNTVASRSLSQWGTELAYMRTIGMYTVITQIARNDLTVYYPSTTLGVSQSGNQPLEKILTVADTTGMTVYLGLYYDSNWWSNEGNTTYLNTLTVNAKTVIDELWSLYSTHPSWKGWYISTEPDNWTTRLESDRINLVNYFLLPVSDYCHTKSSGKIVSISPFFNDQLPMTAPDWQTWWTNTLTTCTSLDLLMLQDGIGVGHSTLTTSIPTYYAAIKNATDSTGRMFWSDVEIFDSSFNPAPFGRITTQLLVEQPYVTGMVSWEYYYYMSPNAGSSQALLYCNYSAYVYGVPSPCTTISTTNNNICLNKFYSVSPSPSPTYPDDGIKLTDGLIPNYNWASEVGWSNPSTNPIITVDLGSVYSDITDIRAYCLRDTGSAVNEPQYVTISISTDNVFYTIVGNAPQPGSLSNPGTNLYQWTGTGIAARYLRWTIIPTGTAWTMANEVEAYQSSQVPVEFWYFYATNNEIQPSKGGEVK